MQLEQIAAPRRRPVAHVIRPIARTDGEELQIFIRGLSPASRYSRFMMAMRELPDYMLDRFIRPLPGREAVLVAATANGTIIGLAQYVADEFADGCEFAVVVGDAWQRQGLGIELLEALSTIASENAMGYFHADVLADNYPMRALARKLHCYIRVDPRAPFVVEISRAIDSPAVSAGLPTWQ